MLLRYMLKFKRLACGIEDVIQYNNAMTLSGLTIRLFKIILKLLTISSNCGLRSSASQHMHGIAFNLK